MEVIKHLRFTKNYYLLILILVTFFVFINITNNDFLIESDDLWQVLENPFILQFSKQNLIFHFYNFYAGQYSPINTLFYLLIYNIDGFNPFMFHVFLLIIHILNVLLIFFFAQEIISKIIISDSNKKKTYSLFIALFFAVNPLQVQSVAWVSASKVLLYSFFMLLSLTFYIKYVNSKKIIYFTLVIFFYLLSFGSKEQALILPINLLLIDIIFDRNKKLNLYFKEKVFLEKLLIFIITFLLIIFSIFTKKENFFGNNDYNLSQNIKLFVFSFLDYIFQAFLPISYYCNNQYRQDFFLKHMIMFMFLAIYLLFFVYRFKKNKLLFFGFNFFLINIFFVLHIIPMPRFTVTEDRYMYLSLLGIGFIGLAIFEKLKQIFNTHFLDKPLIILYLIILSIHTYSKVNIWNNEAKQIKINESRHE